MSAFLLSSGGYLVGVFVPELAADDLRDVFFVRATIESAAIRRVVARGEREIAATQLHEVARCIDQAIAAGDLEAGGELVQAVGWPHRSTDIEVHIALGQGLTTRDGTTGRLLGAGLWWAFGDSAARVGLVVVDPRCQGRGLGKRLMAALLDKVGDRAIMLLATEAGTPLYTKLGFRRIGVNCQHQGEIHGHQASVQFTGDRRIRRARHSEHEVIERLDEEATGIERRAALRHLLTAGQTAVLVERGEIRGYAVRRPFGRGAVIGPIVAAQPDDAIALFAGVAGTGFVRVDRPDHAAALGEHLVARGLPCVDASPIMVRGDWPDSPGPRRVFGLASHALG